jgi:L-galactose dehydrogenase
MGRARLGRTDLDVSVASIGTGDFSRLGREYGATPGESVRVLRAAMDAGIDFIDTAADYRTEVIVARAVALSSPPRTRSTVAARSRPATS